MSILFWRKKEIPWPETPFDEIKKRARLLVIDDESFIYLDLFKKHGYSIDQWVDVDDLSRIEHGGFDLILLDVQGVGKRLSPTEQGLGLLRHIRAVNPAQIVIAFSGSDYSLKYQDFFKLADATLPKSADYVDFQRQVDDLLRARFSMGFYVGRIAAAAQVSASDRQRLDKEATDAITTRNPHSLRKFLFEKVMNKDNVEIAIKILKVGIEVADKWQK